jgi:hypothetical protein
MRYGGLVHVLEHDDGAAQARQVRRAGEGGEQGQVAAGERPRRGARAQDLGIGRRAARIAGVREARSRLAREKGVSAARAVGPWKVTSPGTRAAAAACSAVTSE